jgi:hypothetical protein
MPSLASAKHEDKMLIGDIHNGAKLFPLLYYSRRSVEQPKLLAAHTILTGRQCAASSVVYRTSFMLIKRINSGNRW